GLLSRRIGCHDTLLLLSVRCRPGFNRGFREFSPRPPTPAIPNHPYVAAATSALRLSFDMAVLRKGSKICVLRLKLRRAIQRIDSVFARRLAMGLIELIVTVCALSLPSCEASRGYPQSNRVG